MAAPRPGPLPARHAPPIAYVSNNGSNTVTPIQTGSGKAGKPIKVAYVTNFNSGTVTPIQPRTT
jgi:DNA-binding beta-propeller fold protein YncE